MDGQMLTSKVSTLAPSPSPSVVSPFIWAKRNLHNEHVKRVIRAKERGSGESSSFGSPPHVALLMSLPDIRDGVFQRKILHPHP